MLALYDNQFFFENYLKLRSEKDNYNDLFEQPIMLNLIVDNIQDKDILEIGCGYGATSVKFSDLGAKSICAIDISEKMLKKAMAENSRENINYKLMDATKLSELVGKWDIAYSSLAFHYIEDLDKLFKEIYNHLNEDGILIFSMEHPIVTATFNESINDFNDVISTHFFKLDHYAIKGQRNINWLETPIVKYHHTVSDIANAIIEAGFIIEKILEPLPEEKYLKTIPRMQQEIHRPSYLICLGRKK